MLADYEKYLNRALNDNYWSDEGISIAGEMLEDFSDADWEGLSKAWPKMLPKTKIRCAETFDTVEDERARVILVAMLSDRSASVVIAAAGVLRSYAASGKLKLSRAELDNIVSAQEATASNLDKQVITELLKIVES